MKGFIFRQKLNNSEKNLHRKVSIFANFVRSGMCSTTFARSKGGTCSARSKGGMCSTNLKCFISKPNQHFKAWMSIFQWKCMCCDAKYCFKKYKSILFNAFDKISKSGICSTSFATNMSGTCSAWSKGGTYSTSKNLLFYLLNQTNLAIVLSKLTKYQFKT